jgi:hypothetical protein
MQHHCERRRGDGAGDDRPPLHPRDSLGQGLRAWIQGSPIHGGHGTILSLLPLSQAEKRKDGQDHNDQTDEIDEPMHVPLLRLLPRDSTHKTAVNDESS